MKTSQWLGYLGLWPFILFVFYPALVNKILAISPLQGFIFYSAIILSFLSGTLWKKHSLAKNTHSQFAAITFSLLAYLCLLIPFNLSIIFLPFAYIALLITEYLLGNDEEKSENNQYFKMRVILTFIVSALHVVALIRWIS